jgi:2-dehydro-3-deoxyphosphooctonate aldolase (KDO 8-P synthase)
MKLLAGPCVIESRDIVMKIAENLKQYDEDKNIDFYFKASFDKANRSSINSFRGPGIEEGLKILQEVKDTFNLNIITDIHESNQAKPASEVCDILQIPAFLCRQTDLLVEAAKTNCIINIKKAQFLQAENMLHPLNKVIHTRGLTDLVPEKDIYKELSEKYNVWLCERGTLNGQNLVVDYKNIIKMNEYSPVIFDATHSAQVPSTGTTTGGNAKIVPSLAKAAAVVGVDGYFFETHFDPSIALSDGPNMLDLNNLKKTINDIKQIQELKWEI